MLSAPSMVQSTQARSATGALMMKRLRPESDQPPKAGVATVVMLAGLTSLPASGSVMAPEATFTPLSIAGR